MATNPFGGFNQGLQNMQSTMLTLANLKRQEKQDEQANKLSGLQMQRAQQELDTGALSLSKLRGEQSALIDQYGTQGQTDPYGRAMSFQAQEEKDKAQKKAGADAYKLAMDGYLQVSKAVKEGLLAEDQAGPFYHNSLKMAGIDLEKTGVKMEFKKQNGYYSGPIAPESLVMVNGKPTPYNGSGTISKARIAGIDPATNKPIFEMDENTTFDQAKAAGEGKETWGNPYEMTVGGKKAMVQKSSLGQIRPVVQDTSTTVKVTTGTKGEKDIPVAVQEKLQGKIELASDWGKLRDTFDPSFVPKSKFKSLAEFETNIQRVFSGNQPAIDWWMGYFDSRNLLMKDRSGAAVTEPEFRRFEQGAIRANDSPQTIINQLDRAAKKYEGHANAFIDTNSKNHPQGVKSFTEGMGYDRKKSSGKGGAVVTKGGFKVTVVP